MTALANILMDVLYQLRLSGGLMARLKCVLGYYWFYAAGRRRGLSQSESRLLSLSELARRGISKRLVKVAYPPGMTMELDAYSASFLLMEFAIECVYTKRAAFIPRAGWTVVDVGGHQGLFAVDAARRVGPSGRLIAIEAFPGNRLLLEKNLKANGLSQAVVVAAAAMDFSGEATMYSTELVSGGQSLVFKEEGRRPLAVRADTLDNILAEQDAARPDLVKIDVEGACLIVLKGAAKTLAGKPLLVMEVEGTPADMDAVRDYVSARGYHTTQEGSVLYAEPGDHS